jgi:mRNA-degrading endonuclease RelE of RelBE toxin-antitoxin system
MSFEVRTIPEFERRLRVLAKRYRSLRSDFAAFLAELARDPKTGTALGRSCFKVRMRIAAKQKGKSGGARVITYVHVAGSTVWLLTIYDESERATIADKELVALLTDLPR